MTTLYVNAYTHDIYDNANSIMVELLFFTASSYYLQNVEGPVAFQYGAQNPAATPYPTFPTIDAAITYFSPTYAQNLVNDVNTAIGSSFYATYDVEKIDAPTLSAINAISIDSIADGSSYKKITAAEKSKVDGLATVATSGAYSDLTGTPTIPSAGPTIYSGTTALANAKIMLLSGSTNSSGLVVFQLTTTGLSTGTAIFSNLPAINIDINSSAAAYGYSYAFSNSNKTLTVTVTQPTSLLSLGLLPNVAVASGVTVNARAFGN